MARVTLFITALLALVALSFASQMILRNAGKPTLKVGKLGAHIVAVISATQGGKATHTLAWGATDFRPYSATTKQYSFTIDHSGGYGSPWGTGAWAKVKNECKQSKTLQASLPWCIYACVMPDGKQWAMQVWQRGLPNMGVKPTTREQDRELHLSHWTGKPPVLWMKVGWSKQSGDQLDHMYGTLSAHGVPVYGKSSTGVGNPTDSYGRNIYVELINPAWTKRGAHTQSGGWIRWNGFLSHHPRGNFCASVYNKLFGVTFPDYLTSTAFRAYVMGPGVTPIVKWTGPPPGNYQAGGFPSGYYVAPTSAPAVTSPRKSYNAADAAALAHEQQLVAGSADKCYTVYL